MFIFDLLRINLVAADSLFFVIQYEGLPSRNTHVSGRASLTLRGIFYQRAIWSINSR
jgi:hypothetical protein